MPQNEADRTIKILPETRWVNVTGGEVIWFVSNNSAFGWSFDAQTGPSSFDLQRIAPPGFLDRPVTTYVAPDPRRGGDDGDRGN